jgi:hypothetical protein
MDLLTLGLIGVGIYLFTRNSGTPAVIGNGNDVIEPPVTPATPTVPLLVPTYSEITPEYVAQVVGAQTGTMETGLRAQAAIAQQGANYAAQQISNLGITPGQIEWFRGILNQTNPATGMYWTWDDIIAASGMTREQIQALSTYFQQVNLYNVSIGAA